MTPTPPLPPEDADVATVREALELIDGWLPPMGMTSIPEDPIKPAQANALHKARRDIAGALFRLTARLQEAERERDEAFARFEKFTGDMAEHITERAAREAALRDLLTRIRQWDMLNPAFGAGEPTADASYWRSEIDRALAATANPGASE